MLREGLLFCVSVRVLGADSTIVSATMVDSISVSEALKLASTFKGGKRKVLAFISIVDTAFEVINQDNADILYKFVLTWISGETRVAIKHRNLENWGN